MPIAHILIRQRQDYPFEVVVEGARALGYQTVFGVHQRPQPEDLLITWTPWLGSLSQRLGEQHTAQGGKWVVLENGYIPTPYGQGTKEFYCVGLNGYNGYGDHRNVGSSPDRWDALSLEITPWRTAGEHVALIAQMGGHDARLTMPPNWPDDVMRRLRALTGRPVLYRPKPMRPRHFSSHHDNATVLAQYEELPVEAYFKDAWVMVTYNSKQVVIAWLHGVPALYDGPKSIIGTLVPRGIDRVECPPMPEREQFFCDLAYAQWSADEIKTGQPFERLLR